MRTFLKSLLSQAILCGLAFALTAQQTHNFSPILLPDSLPFTLSIDQSPVILPNGIHSYAFGVHEGKWLLMTGRTNGMHGFDNDNPDTNFPPRKQNTIIYVVDMHKNIVYSRSLNDSFSGLSQKQVDQLSVTSPQFFQKGATLYICGGYGFDSTSGQYLTQDSLTAVNIPKMMKWVMNPSKNDLAVNHIRQTTDPFLQVTGGYMDAVDDALNVLLIFGQNFSMVYTDPSDGNYTQQVRKFTILDDGVNIAITNKVALPQQSYYRRRDLNVLPIIQPDNTRAYIALSGVFTPSPDDSIWTVPVTIQLNGSAFMPDPSAPDTLKQSLNNYVCPSPGIYEHSTRSMFIPLLGGISYQYFEDGIIKTDPNLPWVNQVATIKIDKHNVMSQYLMLSSYPFIPSTIAHPGNPLRFGGGANFILSNKVHTYKNGVIKLDRIYSPTVIGYVVGGIMSAVKQTETPRDSAASPYIFRVILQPKPKTKS